MHTEVLEPLKSPAKTVTPTTFRIQSVDLLRGAVMIIMAIDHVRVYSGIPAGGPTADVFFTRWITHYCAPAFAFLAGTSAFLYWRQRNDHKAVARFLFTRGIVLVLLELTVVRFFWMFNFHYATFTFSGVIWMLGWCMVLMAAVVRFNVRTLAIAGVLIIAAQQVFQFVPALFPTSVQESVARYWGFFYPAVSEAGSGAARLSGTSGMDTPFGISIFYVIIPWIGVMMTGYAFGSVLTRPYEEMRRLCLRIGLAAVGLFLVVGTVLALRDGDNDAPFLFRLLGQQKYPPSQLFLLMTLGPLIALVPWAERASGKLADAVKVIGKVPMFYYLAHLLLIHLSAFVVNLVLYGSIHQDWYANAPFVGMGEQDRWGLPVLYLVWAIDVAILFVLCRWYASFKREHTLQGSWRWLKYI